MEEGTKRPSTPVKWQHPNNHNIPHPRPQPQRRPRESGGGCGGMICRARFVALLAVVGVINKNINKNFLIPMNIYRRMIKIICEILCIVAVWMCYGYLWMGSAQIHSGLEKSNFTNGNNTVIASKHFLWGELR